MTKIATASPETLQRYLTDWIYCIAPSEVIDAWRDHAGMHAEPYVAVAEAMAADAATYIFECLGRGNVEGGQQ